MRGGSKFSVPEEVLIKQTENLKTDAMETVNWFSFQGKQKGTIKTNTPG